MKNNTADKEALLEKVLRSFKAYYNIDRETPAEPFDAEASFDMRDEQYFLTKSARISQSDSHEYVFFRLLDHLDPETFHDLDRKAWYYSSVKQMVSYALMNGTSKTAFSPDDTLTRAMLETTLSRVDLSGSHKSTDACLVIIADTVDPEAARQVRKTDHYKSYRLGLKGWSTCRMTVYECQTGTSFCNRRGEDLSMLFQA